MEKSEQKYSEGNTVLLSKKKDFKSRLQCFTCFKEEEPTFDIAKMQYLAYGKEIAPTTGKHHWQGFVYWHHPKTISASAKILKNAHVEHCRGSIDANEKYCSKENEYTTHGEKPTQGKRTDLDTIKNKLINGEITINEILLNEPMTYHLYGRTLEKIVDADTENKIRTWMTKGIWYYGKTGCGKSHKANENYSRDTHYIWNSEDKNWWDNYKGQETVILDDFRGELKYGTLLKLVDRYDFSVPRRGRAPYPFLAKTLIVTSPLKPDEVYYNMNIKDCINQLLRRFEVIKIV